MKFRQTSGKKDMRKQCAFTLLFGLIGLLLPQLAIGQDEPRPQERVSQPGEIQTGRKRTKVSNSTVMKPEQRPAATLVNGKTLTMEGALKAPQRPLPGNRQPNVNVDQAENPAMGSGEQKPRTTAEEKPLGSHLQLVLKLSSTGAAEVVSAKDVPGPAPSVQTGPGQWVYAVLRGNTTIAAQGIPDPFEMRSFAPPPGSPLEGQGHHIERAQTALVPVAVPNLSLRSAEISTLSLQLYRVKEGAPVLHVDPSVFQKLLQEQRLEMKIHVPAATLSRQIRLRAPATNPPQ